MTNRFDAKVFRSRKLARAAIEDADHLSNQQINFNNEPSVSYAAEGRP